VWPVSKHLQDPWGECLLLFGWLVAELRFELTVVGNDQALDFGLLVFEVVVEQPCFSAMLLI
jgi:hypothetical protein